jgi:hypothetical protein
MGEIRIEGTIRVEDVLGKPGQTSVIASVFAPVDQLEQLPKHTNVKCVVVIQTDDMPVAE